MLDAIGKEYKRMLREHENVVRTQCRSVGLVNDVPADDAREEAGTGARQMEADTEKMKQSQSDEVEEEYEEEEQPSSASFAERSTKDLHKKRIKQRITERHAARRNFMLEHHMMMADARDEMASPGKHH